MDLRTNSLLVTQPSPTHHLFTSFDGMKGNVDNAIDNARAFGLTMALAPLSIVCVMWKSIATISTNQRDCWKRTSRNQQHNWSSV
jgi:hypothetical protein